MVGTFSVSFLTTENDVITACSSEVILTFIFTTVDNGINLIHQPLLDGMKKVLL